MNKLIRLLVFLYVAGLILGGLYICHRVSLLFLNRFDSVFTVTLPVPVLPIPCNAIPCNTLCNALCYACCAIRG